MNWQFKFLAATLGLLIASGSAISVCAKHSKNEPQQLAISLGGKKKKKESTESQQEKAPAVPELPKPVVVEPSRPAAPPVAADLVAPIPSPSSVSEAPPPIVPDAALVSILKDISKSMKDSPEVLKFEDPCQKAAVALTQEALDKAINRAELPTNRILDGKQKTLAETWVRPESWDSGELTLSNNCKVSLNAIWAKKVEGTLNLAVAGNCGCKPSADGTRLGEFVVVLNGKSAVDKGFDIQSQSEVTFWLGKINSFTVDAACCSTPTATEGSRPQGATIVLKSLATERTRGYASAVASFNQQIQTIKDRIAAEAKAEADAKAFAEAQEKRKIEEAKAEEELKKAAAEKAAAEKVAKAAQQNTEQAPSAVVASVANGTELAMSTPLGGRTTSSAGTRTPGASAQMMLPEKAVAGQYMTVAVLTPNHAAEPLVQLTFNDSPIATGEDGKALFLVPAESIPGPTLRVGMPARPDSGPLTVTILQPLESPSSQQIPRVDVVSRLVQAKGTLTIDGHNFDGVADRNRVIIDGVYDARVLVASPVELKADIPGDLIPGPHSVTISTNGLRSNPGQFDVASAELQVDQKEAAKDVMNRLILRVTGTKEPMRVRVKNLSPDVLKLGKTNEFVVNTPGGPNNSVVLPAQRFKKSPYHVQLVFV
jgi:hypothetical protein